MNSRETDSVKLIFEVEDVESERARLESLGIQVLRRPGRNPEKRATRLILRATFFKSVPHTLSLSSDSQTSYLLTLKRSKSYIFLLTIRRRSLRYAR